MFRIEQGDRSLGVPAASRTLPAPGQAPLHVPAMRAMLGAHGTEEVGPPLAAR